MATDNQEQVLKGQEISRRDVLKRGAIAGAGVALVWTRPAFASTNLAQTAPGSVAVAGGGEEVKVRGVKVEAEGLIAKTGGNAAELLAAGLGAVAAGGAMVNRAKARRRRKGKRRKPTSPIAPEVVTQGDE